MLKIYKFSQEDLHESASHWLNADDLNGLKFAEFIMFSRLKSEGFLI